MLSGAHLVNQALEEQISKRLAGFAANATGREAKLMSAKHKEKKRAEGLKVRKELFDQDQLTVRDGVSMGAKNLKFNFKRAKLEA